MDSRLWIQDVPEAISNEQFPQNVFYIKLHFGKIVHC